MPGILAVQAGDIGDSLCYSSSPRDGGVRFKQINLTDAKWTLVDLCVLNQTDLALALRFYERRVGLRYDLLAILGFALPFGEHDDEGPLLLGGIGGTDAAVGGGGSIVDGWRR